MHTPVSGATGTSLFKPVRNAYSREWCHGDVVVQTSKKYILPEWYHGDVVVQTSKKYILP
jgi:hypothetical protein